MVNAACMGVERTASVLKASSWVTCWLNIAIAACRWVHLVVGGKAPEREMLAEAI